MDSVVALCTGRKSTVPRHETSKYLKVIHRSLGVGLEFNFNKKKFRGTTTDGSTFDDGRSSTVRSGPFGVSVLPTKPVIREHRQIPVTQSFDHY